MANTIYGDGDRLAGYSVADGTRSKVIAQAMLVDTTGTPITIGGGGTAASPTVTTTAPLPVGTDRSANVTLSSVVRIAANASRIGLVLQNVGANNVGINEFGGTAAIGTAGTYTLVPGASMRVNTQNGISMIASPSSSMITATEW